MMLNPQLINCGFLVLGVFFGIVITSVIEVRLHRTGILNLLSLKKQLQQLAGTLNQVQTDMVIHQNRNQERIDALEQENWATTEQLERLIDDNNGDDDCEEDEVPEQYHTDPELLISEQIDEFWSDA